jgi:predicted DNA-binding mobile mystery protein A
MSYIYNSTKLALMSINEFTMSVKNAVRRQYRTVVDRAVDPGNALLRLPPEGWLRTVRKSLGMSGAQLAERMGVTRSRIAQQENAELTGGVTMKSMRLAAQAMGCTFVYAIIPAQAVEDLVIAQARKKAMVLVGTASKHMALESQTLTNNQMAQEIERLTRDIVHEMPPDLWNDK